MATRPRNADALARDLQAAWNRRLYQWWHNYNSDYLGHALVAPMIRVSRAERTLGSWCSPTRTISICFRHIAADPWGSVMETLRHEMAHQYVDEVLKAHQQPPHGEAFRAACAKLRCPDTATSKPGDAAGLHTHAEREEEQVLRVLRKLLALAESANEHEAQAALQKARHLLVKYNISLVEADRERAFSSRCIGTIKARHAAYELLLGSLLTHFFFVEVLWQTSYDAASDREGTVLEIYGTPHNLSMAEYVYAYLCTIMVELWRRHQCKAAIRSNRERLRFFAGVVEGFYESLTQQAEKLASTHALVWAGDPRLRAYYRHMNPHIRTRRTQGVRQTEVFDAGKQAGGRVRLRKPLATSGRGGRLLPR